MLIYFVMVASEAPLIQKDDMRSRVHEACGTSDIKRALDKLYLLLRFLAMTKIDTLSSFSGKRYLDDQLSESQKTKLIQHYSSSLTPLMILNTL